MAEQQHQILEPQFKLGEYARNVWRVTLPLRTPFEALLAPAAWANVARKLRAGDHVEVLAEDFSAHGELLVRRATATEAVVGVLQPYSRFDKGESLSAPTATADDFTIEHNATEQWRIVRKADATVILKDLVSENTAKKALAAHLKSAG